MRSHPKQSPILARLDKWRAERDVAARQEMSALFYEMLTRPSQTPLQPLPNGFVWGPKGPMRRPEFRFSWRGKE